MAVRPAPPAASQKNCRRVWLTATPPAGQASSCCRVDAATEPGPRETTERDGRLTLAACIADVIRKTNLAGDGNAERVLSGSITLSYAPATCGFVVGYPDVGRNIYFPHLF